eukprot:gene36314-biopygen1867
MQGTACDLPLRGKLTDPTLRAGLTPSQRRYLATEDIISSADLVTLDPEFRLTTWRTEPTIPDWLQKELPEAPIKAITSPFIGRGQIWHVQPPGTTLGAPGSTFFIQDYTLPQDGAPAEIQIYRWTLEALQANIGNSISLSQRPQVLSGTLTDFFPPGQEVRRLQVTSRPTKQQLQTRKDSRPTRKSSYITSITRSPPPSLQVRHTQGATDLPTAPPSPCDIYVGHYHAPSMVQDQLNDGPTPMVGSIAYYTTGEWRLRRFQSLTGPELTYASSYRTLLYGLTLRAVYDHRHSDEGTRIHVPHPSLLARLLRTTKTRLKNITQLALLRRIHELTGPNITFYLCLPLSRLAIYKAFWKQDRWGSFWTGNWNEEDAGPSPGSVVTEALSSLIPQKPKGMNDYDLAKSQIFQVSGGKLRGFPDETAAVVADQLRLTLELQRHRDRVHAEGTELISVYTDGSYTKAEPLQHLPAKAGWGFIAVTQTDDRVLCQRNNFLMMDLDDIHYHGAKNKSNNTAEVTAIGEALKWIHQQPPDHAISYEICSDSYYGIDAVDVMPGSDSSCTRNGRLIQWAYDQLALTRSAGSIVQFRKVKAHRTDASRDSRRNRDADKLADQGRLIDLTEYSVPDQPTDEDERQTQPFQHPLDWDNDLDALVHPVLRPETGQWVPVSIHNQDTVTPMPTVTQHDNVPLVHPSMYFYPVPCKDNHPNTKNSSQRAPQRPPVNSPRPGTPGGSHRTPSSGDRRTQQDAGASAQGSPAWNKRPRSTGKARPARPEPLALRDSHLRQHHPNPLPQANLTHTDATSLNESGISNKLRDAAITRKSESLAATRQWFASTAPGLQGQPSQEMRGGNATAN